MNENVVKIALIGNPNCGKTTLFNLLTGSNQYIGNRAGVTVEQKEGFLRPNKIIKENSRILIADLPGIYSLSPYSPEENISLNYILTKNPDVIICLCDSTKLQRSIYLAEQLMETKIPILLALNMIDLAEKQAIITDLLKLSKLLGTEAAAISAAKGKGCFEMLKKAVFLAKKPYSPNLSFFDSSTEKLLQNTENIITPYLKENNAQQFSRLWSVKLFQGDRDFQDFFSLPPKIVSDIDVMRKAAEKRFNEQSDEIIINQRYNYAESITRECVITSNKKESLTQKADKILTGKYTAIPCFAAIISLVYFLSAGSFGQWLSNIAKSLITVDFPNYLSGVLKSLGCARWLSDLILNGLTGGVGTVLSFLPQLMILFVSLSLLEDWGYMSRIAFIFDSFFRKFGLSGKSIIPMLIATGCGVPAIMSSRTVENPGQRRTTILTSTFMPCTAKIPVISLIAANFFKGGWWIAPICYFLGIISVLLSGLVLKRIKPFSSQNTPFILELPDYRLPKLKNVFKVLVQRCGSYLKRAGSVILLASAAVWFLSYFGIYNGNIVPVTDISDSILKNTGDILAVFFKPLGFGNWQAAVAAVMGLTAKEEIVGVLGVLGAYDMGRIFTSSLSAFSFLVFNLLCAPCIAAVSAMNKEFENPLLTLFALLYQTAFAYMVSFCIYNIGTALSGVV